MKDSLVHLAKRSIHKAIVTIEEIVSENDDKRLDAEDLDDLKDCWDIIKDASHFCPAELQK